MAFLTERVRITMPTKEKARWQAEAAARGISLGAFLRISSEDFLACYELDVFAAQLEMKRLGATLQ